MVRNKCRVEVGQLGSKDDNNIIKSLGLIQIVSKYQRKINIIVNPLETQCPTRSNQSIFPALRPAGIRFENYNILSLSSGG